MVDSNLWQLVFVTISWSSTIILPFLELNEEDCFGHAYFFHPCDVASPVQLHLKQDALYPGMAGWLSLSDTNSCHLMPRM